MLVKLQVKKRNTYSKKMTTNLRLSNFASNAFDTIQDGLAVHQFTFFFDLEIDT